MFELPITAIFDLDNTLYDYDVANKAGLQSLVEFLSMNLKVSEIEVASKLRESRDQVKLRLGPIASSHSRLLYVREFLNMNNIYTNASFALECEQVFWRAYLDKTKPFEGVHELMACLRLAKTKIVLVTDLTTQTQLKKLAWLGLDKTFELIITSEEAGGDKDTGLPEKLLRRYVSPDELIWCIGDKDHDHLFEGESIFFQKMEAGKFHAESPRKFLFSSYQELFKKLNLSDSPS
jgi:FMN phosphatase YigB (HAD superfamily)